LLLNHVPNPSSNHTKGDHALILFRLLSGRKSKTSGWHLSAPP